MGGMPENPSVWMWHITAPCWHQLANCPARWPGDSGAVLWVAVWLAMCKMLSLHFLFNLSDPVVPGLVVSTLQDHTTPSGPLPERSKPELTKKWKPETQRRRRKGTPPPRTHQRDSYILQNLRKKLFSMCIFKTCLLGVSLRCCWPTVTAKNKEEEKPSDREIQEPAPCKGSRLSPRRKVLEDFLITMAISR